MNEHAAVACRWFEEVWNQRRAETIDELLTAESVCYAEDGHLTGPQQFREQMHKPFLEAFPDLRVTVEDVIADGPQVVVRWTATGTHTGTGLGFAPTGKTVNFRGLTWLCIQDGKLMKGWQSSNIPDVIRTLAEAAAAGAVPAGERR
jgi:steroid delta-isomerase-like uncharacterized protein